MKYGIKHKEMKRYSNLYNDICSVKNLKLADKKASSRKGKQHGVVEHNKNSEVNINKLHGLLINKT